MKLSSPDMLFWGLAALAGLAGLAALWLVARSGKPLLALPAAPALAGRLGPWAKNLAPARLLEGLRYLLTSREARYGQPWVFIIGEKSSGKSSLLGACASHLRDPAPAGQEVLQITDAVWQPFGHGVLMDAEGRLCVAPAGSADGKRWQAVLDTLDKLRPERPIDKLILVLSARTLLEGGEDSLMERAREALRQLQSIQDRFEFALPVYLVITHCDAVAGFTPFWQAQAETCRQQIFGWTAPPALESQPPETWVATAFGTLLDQLRRRLLAVAASAQRIEETDQVFLFPVAFRRLAAPLTRWFEVVFQPSRWSRGFFCRGIYFTGSLDAAGDLRDGPRTDLCFLGDLVKERIFAEPHLAAPLRQSVWSRNSLIRRVQYGVLAAMLLLLAALAHSTWSLNGQVNGLENTLKTMDSERYRPAPETCLDTDKVYELLRQTALIEARTIYWDIPASWFDDRALRSSAKAIVEGAFNKKIMPAIECRMLQKAQTLKIAPAPATGDTLAAARKRFLDYLAAVHELEQNRKNFTQVARSVGDNEQDATLRAFNALAAYAFERPLPEELKRERGVFSRALANFKYTRDGRPVEDLPPNQEEYARQIMNLSRDLRATLDGELDFGANLLARLRQDGEAPPGTEDDTAHLLRWLDWVRLSWLGATAAHNPCKDILDAASPLLDGLNSGPGYQKSIAALADTFGSAQCYQHATGTLAKVRVAPYGSMFSLRGDTLDLNPALVPEFAGLTAAMELRYMHLAPTPGFRCLNDAAGWNPALLAEASGYAREYLNFTKARKPAPGEASLYDRLARRQLAAAMDSALSAAQLHPAPLQALAGVNGLSMEERRLSRESADFAGASGPLLEALGLYSQLGFSAAARDIARCSRDLAADSLRRARSLAEASRLYDALGVDAVFPLPGDTAVTRDWLDRQSVRSRVLAGYASQYVSFLKNSQTPDAHLWSEDQDAAFWDNTIAELERYVQFKVPNGQVAQLDTLFLKAMAGMSDTNCRRQLADYGEPEYGNDLFSRLRRLRLSQARSLCADRHDAPALEAYQLLADRFNRELGGRYPFAGPAARDASPTTLKAFLADYATQREQLRGLLDGAGRRPQLRHFLDQMDGVAAFFRGNLSLAPASAPLQLTVHFNTLPGLSSGANQVLSWKLATGNAQAAYGNQPGTLEWAWGLPMELRLAWASGSRWRPVADLTQADMGVENATAVFRAAGPWALLRLIQGHRPHPLPATDPMSPELLQLEFSVPVVSADGAPGVAARDRSRLHLGLEISDRKAAAPLSWPQFPTNAPASLKD